MHLQSLPFCDWWQPWLKLTNKSNKRLQILRYIMSSPYICDLNWIQQPRPQMPFCTYLKQLGALPISQNSRGAKSESVSTKDTRDAYDIINRFISKERKMVLSGADRSDRSLRPVCPGRHQNKNFIIQISTTLAQIH